MNSNIRKTTKNDLNGIKSILNSIDLFPAEILEEMISDFFDNAESQALWLTYLENHLPLGFVYCDAEMLTDRTWNMYAIGIMKSHQGKGIGTKLLKAAELMFLKENQARLIIVDTSGMEEYKLVRNFYLKNGYTQEASIRDFWAEGDDKVVFWKRIS